MNHDLFALLCAALGHDPSSVRVIRLSAGKAGVTYTEPSGMPRSTVYELDRPAGDAAGLGEAGLRVLAPA
jgi:hypothetical protein